MSGPFGAKVQMIKGLKALCNTEAMVVKGDLLGTVGQVYRGLTFHCSNVTSIADIDSPESYSGSGARVIRTVSSGALYRHPVHLTIRVPTDISSCVS